MGVGQRGHFTSQARGKIKLGRKKKKSPRLGGLGHIGGLGALLSLNNLELDRVAFLQALITFGSDRAVMYEHVGAILSAKKTVTLRIVKPLNRTFQTFHVLPLLRIITVHTERGRKMWFELCCR